MSQIQTARYEQFLRRLLRLVEGGVLPRMQNDVSPVLNIEDPSDDALLFWKGHRLAHGSIPQVSPAGGDFATISLFNPLNSGKLFTVAAFELDMDASANISFSFTQTRTLAVSSAVFFADSRAAIAARPVGELGGDELAVSPTNFGYVWQSGANSDQHFVPRFVISPGNGLQINNLTANADLGGSFFWLERSAEDSELRTT